MKIAVIDVGSNSVRLMMWQDGKTLYKDLNTTRLGEGTAQTRLLTDAAIERTVLAINVFKNRALSEGAEAVYAFATEAVRSAKNREKFLSRAREVCSLDVEVLSGEQEADFGLKGALQGGDGVVIDVGGASSEVIFSQNGERGFFYSLPLGSVRLYDLAGRSPQTLESVIDRHISPIEYPKADDKTVYAVGGTATTIASVFLGLKKYDPAAIHGTVISTNWIGDMAQRTLSMPVDEVKKIEGMEPRRADVIGGGAMLLYKLLLALSADSVTVSESDNLEGYAQAKLSRRH